MKLILKKVIQLIDFLVLKTRNKSQISSDYDGFSSFGAGVRKDGY